MSQTLTIPDDLYDTLEVTCEQHGLFTIAHLLQVWQELEVQARRELQAALERPAEQMLTGDGYEDAIFGIAPPCCALSPDDTQ
jgi:hypothetical protein